jgi:hypothetical protein
MPADLAQCWRREKRGSSAGARATALDGAGTKPPNIGERTHHPGTWPEPSERALTLPLSQGERERPLRALQVGDARLTRPLREPWDEDQTSCTLV